MSEGGFRGPRASGTPALSNHLEDGRNRPSSIDTTAPLAPSTRHPGFLRTWTPMSWRAFAALLRRDLVVLSKDLPAFIARTVMQPLLLMFVFTYVFPKIGQGIGSAGGASAERRSARCSWAGWSPAS